LPLGGPALNIHLLSKGSRLLLLLIGLVLHGEGPGTWLRCDGPLLDRRDGQKCGSVLQRRCGGDGDSHPPSD
jgi:hypothetical protein